MIFFSSDFSDAASFNEFSSEGMNDTLSDGNSEHNSSVDEDSQLRYISDLLLLLCQALDTSGM